MTEAVPAGFAVEPSASVRRALVRNNVLIESDRLALDAMAGFFHQETPEQPRAILIHDDEALDEPGVMHLIPAPEDSIHAFNRLNTPRAETGDYIVRLPRTFGVKTEDITLALATIFRREQRLDGQLLMDRTGAGVAAGGISLSGVGEFGLHSNWVRNIGYGLFLAGASLIAYGHNRDPIGKMPDISQLRHPIRLLPKGPERDAIEDKTVTI